MISVAELTGPQAPDPAEVKIDWQYELPGAYDAEEILVSVNKIKWLSRLAGLSGITVCGYSEEADAPVASFDPTGRSLAKYIADGEETGPYGTRVALSGLGNSDWPQRYRWPWATIGINHTSLVSQQVPSMIGPGVTREAAASQVLSRELKRGMREAAIQSMMDMTPLNAAQLFGSAALLALAVDSVEMGSPTLSAITHTGYLAAHAIEHVAARLHASEDDSIQPNKPRMSIFPGPCQADRMMLMELGVALSGPVVSHKQ